MVWFGRPWVTMFLIKCHTTLLPQAGYLTCKCGWIYEASRTWCLSGLGPYHVWHCLCLHAYVVVVECLACLTCSFGPYCYFGSTPYVSAIQLNNVELKPLFIWCLHHSSRTPTVMFDFKDSFLNLHIWEAIQVQDIMCSIPQVKLNQLS